jgi:hypothetical protein
MTAVQSDSVTQLADLDAQIATLAERASDVRSQHKAATQKLAIARTLQGRSIADGMKLEANIHAARASELTDEIEGLNAGLASLDERLADARALRASIAHNVAAADLSASRKTLREAAASVDQALRGFIGGELTELLRTYQTARSNAGYAWGQKVALDRKAGFPVEHQLQNPGGEDFAGFPDLADVVDMLQRYSSGGAPGQMIAHAAHWLTDNMRSTATRRGVA